MRLSRPALVLLSLALPACDAPPPGDAKTPDAKAKLEPAPERTPPVANRADKAAPVAPTTNEDKPADAPVTPAPIADTTPHPFGIRDMLAMDRISDPVLSPDGTTIAFVRRVTDLEANRGRTDLWSVPVAGGEPTRLTDHPEADDSPRYAPDGTLYFLSRRSGDTQVWKLTPGTAAATQVSHLPLPVASLSVSPTGEQLAFALEVFVDCADLACTKQRLDDTGKLAASGKLFDRMFVRHWDSWVDGRRSHLFVMPTAGGEPVDVSAGLDADVPSKPFGGSEEYAWTPDGKGIVYGAREAGVAEPWSTDFDLYAVDLGAPTTRNNLTDANPAWDSHPRFSADGKRLVYKAMDRPGYEADRFHLMSLAWPATPGAKASAVALDWDRSVDDLVLAPDGSAIVSADDLGHKSLFAIDLASGERRQLTKTGTVASPLVTGDTVVFLRDDLRHAAELHTISTKGGEPVAITQLNAAKLAAARMGEPEQFSFSGGKGDTVWAWVVKPVDFDPAKKYPIALLIHGGPQGSFGDHFHYRWNPQAYAGAGYAAIMIDFHGSTGYGQAFTDGINDDWGGKPLVDLKQGMAAAVAKYPWLDGTRSCALGASYGGYMINWIAGNWPEQFDCLVNHDGLLDMRSMYYATEELWFPEWEHGGPAYQVPKNYETWNPVNHVAKWKTPMLVVHGALDYRVPETQGLATFTALQRRGVKSKLLAFPDENHWVLKPANSLQWHDTVLAWLGEHTALP
ncbi:MAG: prolyl oligopeptidase family serine peptidase [Deltaproteobacteria bacterium]|nr:prolyl oligopeptidase family serine peptidase [Nannocystaceae bacterium]